jgi:hypothetical protein
MLSKIKASASRLGGSEIEASYSDIDVDIWYVDMA